MAKSSKGAGKSLVRASLSIHEPPRGKSTTPGGLIRTFHFDFNPAQLTISRGARQMPAYRVEIPVPDRWAIVAWVRVLGQSQHAALEDVPADKRGEIKPEVPNQ